MTGPANGSRQRQCSRCGALGHTRTTCERRQARAAAASAPREILTREVRDGYLARRLAELNRVLRKPTREVGP